jgi:hypothetical protein
MKTTLALFFVGRGTHAFSATTFAATRTAFVANSPVIKSLGNPPHTHTRLFNNAPRHDVRSEGATEMDPEEMKLQEVLAEHQQKAVSCAQHSLVV